MEPSEEEQNASRRRKEKRNDYFPRGGKGAVAFGGLLRADQA
jgi:hypothetical protein